MLFFGIRAIWAEPQKYPRCSGGPNPTLKVVLTPIENSEADPEIGPSLTPPGKMNLKKFYQNGGGDGGVGDVLREYPFGSVWR